MRFEGHIKSWTDDRGFGFIEPTKGGQEIFVHVKSFSRRFGRPRVGQLVSFEVELNHEGKKRGKNVEVARPSSRTPRDRIERQADWGIVSIAAIPLFIAIYWVVATVWHVSHWFAAGYIALSVFSFFVYGSDKAAAKAGAWRVSESSLHLFSLAGGWPGALVAQKLLRHKSSKVEFQAVFWCTVCANVSGFVAFHSPFMSRFHT